jgi:hypothetical protein
MSELILIIGIKASGKTVEIKDKLSKITDKNAVVFDYNEEYEDVDIIQPDEAVSFLNGKEGKVARIIPIVNSEKIPYAETQKIVLNILDNIENGILVLEDIRRYNMAFREIYDKIRTLSKNEENNATIICPFGSFLSTPDDFINNAALISLHRQHDNIDRCRLKFESFESFKPFKIASLLVQNKIKDNNYFFCEINNSTSVITGDFSKQEYRNACLDYFIQSEGLYKYSEYYKLN